MRFKGKVHTCSGIAPKQVALQINEMCEKWKIPLINKDTINEKVYFLKFFDISPIDVRW